MIILSFREAEFEVVPSLGALSSSDSSLLRLLDSLMTSTRNSGTNGSSIIKDVAHYVTLLLFSSFSFMFVAENQNSQKGEP